MGGGVGVVVGVEIRWLEFLGMNFELLGEEGGGCVLENFLVLGRRVFGWVGMWVVVLGMLFCGGLLGV